MQTTIEKIAELEQARQELLSNRAVRSSTGHDGSGVSLHIAGVDEISKEIARLQGVADVEAGKVARGPIHVFF